MIINPEKIIINKRELQTGGHRALSLVLFLIFWAGLLYLMRPLVVLLGWALAWFVFDSTLQGTDSLGAVSSVIERYLPIVLALSFTFVSWSVYNRIRFSGKRDKRRSRGETANALSLKEISEAASLRPLDVSQMREAPMVICYFNETTGEIEEIECCSNLDDADMALAVKVKGEDTRTALKNAEKVLEDFDRNMLPPPLGRSRLEPAAAPVRPLRSDPLQPVPPKVDAQGIELDLSPHEAELIKSGLPSSRAALRK